ncbi:hypothetical protein, partial [Pseudomonas sp. 2822-15]|uniref:hypothetical protein n=1 Tax=Pseudomonas sp. 2822-15 TaxID=1712677 RepID=UPI00130422C1
IELLDEQFPPGEFTPTTVIIDARDTGLLTNENLEQLQTVLMMQQGVRDIGEIQGSEADDRIISFDLWFENDPYSIITLSQLE